jgi:2-polyprenyl-6-methoxyphenol hydroxylase-like FAD-dependent oxidoreductase
LRSTDGRVAGVSGVRGDGRPFAIAARFVVGADGLQSLVARLVNAQIEHRAAYATAITYGYWTDVNIDAYEWTFVANASAGAMPTNAGQVCVFANATPERIGRGGVDVIESILRTSSPALAARVVTGQSPARTRMFRAPRGYMRSAWGDGWALVGDAGYFKDPLTAHGMTDALRDAELLARALADAWSGLDESVALAEFQRVRDQISLPLFDISDAIASHQWTSEQIASLSKRLSAAMRDEVTLLAALDTHDIQLPDKERAA